MLEDSASITDKTLGMVVHGNPNNRVVDMEGSWVCGQPKLHREILSQKNENRRHIYLIYSRFYKL